jgi:hypothetical protein
MATVACARERERDDEGAVALAVGPVDEADGREDDGRELDGREMDEDDTFAKVGLTGRWQQASPHCERFHVGAKA